MEGLKPEVVRTRVQLEKGGGVRAIRGGKKMDVICWIRGLGLSIGKKISFIEYVMKRLTFQDITPLLKMV